MSEELPPGVDPTKPSAGRLYDYYLGGTEYLEVDRRAAEQLRQVMPEMNEAAWANRGFLQRASRWMASDRGIRQFIDIGAGLPTRNNTHEAVELDLPDESEPRVVYVDNDPMVIPHAKRLLGDDDRVAFIQGDLREPASVLEHPESRALLDFSQPVGVILAAIMHFVPDDLDPAGLVRAYLDPFPSGSYVAVSHLVTDHNSPEALQRIVDIYENANEQVFPRSSTEIEAMFAGMELVAPYAGASASLTYSGMWGAEDPESADGDDSRWVVCGVARKL